MRIYKEILILTVMGVLGVLAIVAGIYTNSGDNAKATVDHITPTTIEVLESGE